MSYLLERELWLPIPLDTAWAFFSDPKNLSEITPKTMGFEMLDREVEMKKGALINYKVRWIVFPLRWQTLISEWNPPHSFADEAPISPYKFWRHRHTFTAQNNGTLIKDAIEYDLPFGVFGKIAHTLKVRRDLENIFDYREKRVKELLLKPEKAEKAVG